MATLGVEEEYLLLDPHTGLPASVAEQVSDLLKKEHLIDADQVQRELLSCQIETATPVCDSLTEAEESLLNFRSHLGAAAKKAGARAGGFGTAPKYAAGLPEITDKPRYYQIKEYAGEIAADQYVNGLHVHVAVPDREAGVQALNRIRPWLPAIVAMSGNSPFWLDRDSGFSSWRTIIYRRWAVQGCPPTFTDAADYTRRVQALQDVGAILDSGLVTWTARLSDKYPTLEVRAGDAQLEAQDSVLLAGLIRALVVTAVADARRDAAYRHPVPELLDAALWQAARRGLDGELVHVDSGELIRARLLVQLLVEHVAKALEAAGDRAWVDAGIDRLFAIGTGAARQRNAYKWHIASVGSGGLRCW